MKLITTIIFICTLTFGYTQLDIEALHNYATNNVGSCIITMPLDTTNTERYYLQIIPPVLETYSVKINQGFIDKHLNEKERRTSSSLVYLVRPSYNELKLVKKQNNCNLLLNEFEYGKAFCIRENTGRIVYLNKIAIVENGDTFYTLQKQIIECERIVEKEKINIYKNKSLVNPNYPIYEVLGGEWTFKEYICPLTERNSRVSEIQRKLIEQGYDLEVTAFFDAVTKAALIDFQTKHNLEVGTLRMETLKKLGIDISKMTISKY